MGAWPVGGFQAGAGRRWDGEREVGGLVQGGLWRRCVTAVVGLGMLSAVVERCNGMVWMVYCRRSRILCTSGT